MAQAKKKMVKKPVAKKEPELTEIEKVDITSDIVGQPEPIEDVVESVETPKQAFPVKVKSKMAIKFAEENIQAVKGTIFEVSSQERLDLLLGKNEYNIVFVELAE